MTQVVDMHDTWLANLEPRSIEQTVIPPRPWLDRLRTTGMNRFAATGFPGTRMEGWRHTSVAAISKTTFRTVSEDSPAEVPSEVLHEFSFASEAAAELVFVNGIYSPDLSTMPVLARGVRVLPLGDALAHPTAERLENYLGRYARIDDNPFVALNTGFIRDGALIHIPRGMAQDQAIHLLFISTSEAEPTVTHPRVVIVAEDNAQASIVETYAAAGAGVYFTNTVTEIIVGHGARVEHCKVQQESPAAFHVGTTQVEVGRGAYFLSHNVSLGSVLTRNDFNVVLAGAGAEAVLNGLSLLSGRQHVDNHTLLDHREPRCPSHEMYKAVLDGHSTGVFKGKILVRQAAQKTDSKQSSKTLLLSDDAVMHSQPALEIYADDVKCTHGSTTGPVDEEQIFYLRSRGVSLEASRHLLTYAFLAEVSGRIKVVPVRRRIEAIMPARHGLPRDLRVADLL